MLQPKTRSVPLCPRVKKIEDIRPPVVVDGFRFACKGLSSQYVLTHFHADHYIGLDKSFDCGVIYCSPITARLMQLRLGIRRYMQTE